MSRTVIKSSTSTDVQLVGGFLMRGRWGKKEALSKTTYLILSIIGLVIGSIILFFGKKALNKLMDIYKVKKKQKEDIKREKQKKNVEFYNSIWRIDGETLNKMRSPLLQLNSLMSRFPIYPKDWTSEIVTEAKKIQYHKYREIKKKLIEYGERGDQISNDSPKYQLQELLLKLIDNRPEPLALWDEIQEILVATSTPPISEEDLE